MTLECNKEIYSKGCKTFCSPTQQKGKKYSNILMQMWHLVIKITWSKNKPQSFKVLTVCNKGFFFIS